MMGFSKSALLAGACLFVSTGAAAQAQAPAHAPGQGDTAKAAPAAAEIIVTGSRTVKNGNAAPTPVTVVSAQTLTNTTPTNFADGLRKLPIFGRSSSATNLNNGGQNSVGNVLNLRGFGTQRTLVLLDGHRVPPTNADGTVDVNTLPEMLVNRIDIVTGGASAVYGSDAVTGVVNYVLDKNFTGLKGQAQDGISTYGDAPSYRLGLAYGTKIGDRAHFEASVTTMRQGGLLKNDRPYGAIVPVITGAGTAANPFVLTLNGRRNSRTFGGLILNNAANGAVGNGLRDMTFDQNGVLTPFVHGAATGTGGIESGGDGDYNANTSASASLSQTNVFGRFDYDFSDHVKFYAQVNAGWSHNFNIQSPRFEAFRIAKDNAYLPASVVSAMTAAGLNQLQYAREDSNTYNPDAYPHTLDISTGINGRIGDYKYELFYTHGTSGLKQYVRNNIDDQKLWASADAVRDPSGNIVCRVTLTNPGLYPGCVPMNVFGPTAPSAASESYVSQDTYYSLKNTLDDVGFSFAGSPFSTWAGEVQLALSGEYRWNKLDITTSVPGTSPFLADCTGLISCIPDASGTAPARWGTNVVAPGKASNHVGEIAIEADVPLLKDVFLARSLNFNGAFRYTNYSTSGAVTTWKLGAIWKPADEFTVRVTRSRDIRAPTLYDLFGPYSAANSGFSSIHCGCAGPNGLVPLITQGNPDLVPEVAQTWVAGVVWAPRFFPRFSLSLDYYNIKMNNAITQVNGTTPLVQQQCEASGGTSSLCSLYVFPLPFSNTTAANYPTAVYNRTLNVASTKTEGLDVEANYSAPIDPKIETLRGLLSLRALFSYQPVLSLTPLPGSATTSGAGVAGQRDSFGSSKYKITAFVSYSTDRWDLDIQERWRASLKQNGTPNLVYDIPKLPAVAYTDFTFTYKFGPQKNMEMFFSVQNAFNKQPPLFIAQYLSGSPNFFYPAADGDDIIGRYFTTGVKFKF